MAGIEPASERIDPRTPTSLVCFLFDLRSGSKQKRKEAIRLDPKALFHAPRGVVHGTSTF